MKEAVLDKVAMVLNACGKTVVISYDACSSGMGKVCGLAKKTPGAMGKVCDLAKKAPDAAKKHFRSQEHAPAEVVSKGEPQETKPVSAPGKTAEPVDIKLINEESINEERLKKMVKPQLISLCKSLNIECDYTETKTQIITKILERKGS